MSVMNFAVALLLSLATVAKAQSTFMLLPQMFVSWTNMDDYIDLNITLFGGTASWAPSVHGMSGTGVSGYVDSTMGLCVDYNSYDTNIQPTDKRSTVIAWRFGSPSWIVCRLPKQYFAIRNGPQRVIVSIAEFDLAAKLPLPHAKENTAVWTMDVVGGTVEKYKYPNVFIIPVIVGCGLFVIIGIVSRVCNIVLTPTQLRVAKALFGLLLFAMVTLYCVLAGLPYPTLTSVMYATGEGTMLLTGLVMFPISKFFSVALLLYGTSYERMVPWHVLLGMMLFMVGMLHGILALIVIDTQEPRGLSYLNDGWMKRGNVYPIPGIIALCFLFAVAIPAMLRRLSYNIFRYTHLLIVLFIVFAALHYVLVLAAVAPAAVLFMLDVIHRYAPTVRHGKAPVRDVATSGDIVRVRIGVPWTSVGPGDYALLSLMGKCANPIPHPFTIADINHTTGEATFMIKRSGTWTRYLYDGLQEKTITEVICQGPYGSLMVPVARCDRVLLLSGGIGVTPMFTLARAAIDERRPMRFVWVVRNGNEVSLATEQLMSFFSGEKASDVAVELYVTSVTAAAPALPESSPIEVKRGRPDVDSLLKSESVVTAQYAKFGVYVCGPAPLVAEVERCTPQYSNALLHVETFEL